MRARTCHPGRVQPSSSYPRPTKGTTPPQGRDEPPWRAWMSLKRSVARISFIVDPHFSRFPSRIVPLFSVGYWYPDKVGCDLDLKSSGCNLNISTQRDGPSFARRFSSLDRTRIDFLEATLHRLPPSAVALTLTRSFPPQADAAHTRFRHTFPHVGIRPRQSTFATSPSAQLTRAHFTSWSNKDGSRPSD